MPIPTGAEICGKQLFNWIGKLETVATDHQEIEKFLPEIKLKLAGMDREEFIRRVVLLEFDRFLNDYRHGEEIIEPVTEKESRFEKSHGKGPHGQYPGNYTRLFINLGKSDGFYPEQLIELVNSNTKGRKVPIGKIDLLKTFSFFEVDPDYADDLMHALNNKKFMNKKVAVEIAQEKGGKPRSDGFRAKKQSKWPGRKHEKKSHPSTAW
jgi:ATP-dependent RNA helicase DeaD